MKLGQTVNLIAEQKSLLKKIYGQGENLWKILIFDHFNREVNSSLFKMKDLRQNNITLYFHLKEPRQQLHGVTAIYLVQPTLENVELIIKDFEDDLYSSVIIHFSSQPQAQLVSSFAKSLGKKKINALTKINKIQYSFLGFHTIGKNIAVAQDNNELINVISMLKHKPIFVFGPKEADQASFVKERLANSAVFSKEQELISLKQPHNIVLFFNREQDCFPALHHSITYAGLIESIYRLSPTGHKILKGKQSIEIDLNDEMWVDRRNLPTSEMQLQQQFNKIKVKLTGDKDKLDELNDLTEKSKKIEQHIHTVDQLIKEAFARKLNQYYECEMEIYRKRVLGSQIKKDIYGLLESSINEQDKVQLIIITLMYCEHIDIKQIEEFQDKVPSLKKSKLYNDLKAKFTKDTSDGPKGVIGGSGKMLKKFTMGLLSNFKSGDKFLVTKYVQKIRDMRENDIRQLGLSTLTFGDIPNDVKIANIIVYCVGGGCLSEEANLSKFENRVIYLSDKMINALDLI